MPDADSTEKPCRICGRNEWRSVILSEPVDRTGLFTWAQRDVEYLVCLCGHKERVRIVRQDNTLF